ncbi:MAG: phosphate ABC transporter permease PstA [Fimbriimonadaceae bacterium]|nr:phosphate ABC transporter permease PstA [Fimbriimonadaceae bacterium]
MSPTGYRKFRKFKSGLFGALCMFAVLVAAAVLIGLLWTIFQGGIGKVTPQFLTSFPSRLPNQAGVKAAIYGSLWVVGLTAVISIPIGIAAAVYLEEYKIRDSKLSSFIQLNISNLAGVPSIVYGLLGLEVFVRAAKLDRSVLAGALTMSLLILPMIIIVTQEALRAVPRTIREASYGLGATRWQTIRFQVIPAALPGIMTGIILSLSRAIGESAPLITIGAVTFISFTPNSPASKFTVLPIQIFDWTSRPQKGFQEAAAGAIVVLIALLLVLNSAAILIRARARRM